MAEVSVFDKLVTRLSSSERRDMLDRIASSVTVAASESADLETEDTVDLDGAYHKMGLLRRFIITLVALFTGRDRMSVVESTLIRDLRGKTSSRCAEYDSMRDQLRAPAQERFRSLASKARHFSGQLSRVMGRERAAFIAFLAGLHAPDVQERLLADTDPTALGAQMPELSDQEIKRRCTLAMEEALVTLPAATRNAIYHDVRALHCLMNLASFPFDRIITEFSPVAGGDPVPVPLTRIAEDLGRLAGILAGFRPGPSATLFEALSAYQVQDQLEQSDKEVEDILAEGVAAANAAYAGIKEFSVNFPVGDLVRLAHTNIHWRPTTQSGGEDWFAVWKGFWKDRIEQMHRRFSFNRRMDGLKERVRNALELSDVQPFPGYPPGGPDGPARHALTTGLLREVFGEVYPKSMQQGLSLILREGEFYKADNRSEFDDAMREVEKVRVETANLEVRLRPTGDLGMVWKKAVEEPATPEARAEQQEAIATQIDADASALVRRTINAFRSIGAILEGVLFGTVGGRYDTLSNLGQLGQPDSKAFSRVLEKIHTRSKAISEILSEMLNMESLQQG